MDVQRIAPLRGLLGCTTRAESGSGRIGPISLGAKQAGERSAGNPHAAFDAAEAGNVARSRWCDTRRRKSEPTGNTNFDLNRRASPRPYQSRYLRAADVLRSAGHRGSRPRTSGLRAKAGFAGGAEAFRLRSAGALRAAAPNAAPRVRLSSQRPRARREAHWMRAP